MRKPTVPQAKSHPLLPVQAGFTLVEMMIVLAIIAILVTLAIPNTKGRMTRVQIDESLELVKDYQQQVVAYYKLMGEFPANNETLGMPNPDKIVGNYLAAVTLADGALHLELGNKIAEGQTGKVVTLYPVYVAGSPLSPVSWVCGLSAVPEGMQGAGENLTDIELAYLPTRCRY
ncbi:prepilin-type N-terminal cleavage/methylation domain-containing protein [Simiduia sp. 21SJ11W-1]|uniref:pilin n=1 Tax=Simiduia sp. 21SJ11W-1 TaxID=2909669 RepID=UPI00209F5DF7|nr:prepilin-type N-terminal cleavage/methylation domain-containing protein [Simiduia sp. 21SJ11W-1]UTA49352.1 prepilin-type N-terminal cleavage/methylation domain-containing protein [Simiduia sp. 21SJ11W-1]